MFDWLKRCFGEGKIRVEGTLVDGSSFVAKCHYIGDISTMDKGEVLRHVRQEIRVEWGKTVATCRVVGFTSV